MRILIVASFTLFFVLSGCIDGTSVLPKSSGKANEVLLVMDDGLFKTETGTEIVSRFQQDVVGLPWDEPFFDVSRLNRQTYTEMFRLARNIVYFDVSKMYTIAQVKLYKDLHAKDQAFVKVQAPNVRSLDSLMKIDGNRILSFLYTSERSRAISYFKKFENKSVVDSIQALFDLDIIIPSSFNRQNFHEDFVWMASGNVDARQYLAIYTYPYTDDSTFTKQYLLNKRDMLMKKYIPGANEGSYMQTSYVFDPSFRSYKKGEMYIAELRGLWETKGDMMGGPFISHTFLDEDSQNIITIEGFVYAPHKSKRNLMRQLEAIIYTANVGNDAISEESQTQNN